MNRTNPTSQLCARRVTACGSNVFGQRRKHHREYVLTFKLVLIVGSRCQRLLHSSIWTLAPSQQSTTCRGLEPSDMPPTFCSVDLGTNVGGWCEFNRVYLRGLKVKDKRCIEVFCDCKNMLSSCKPVSKCQEKPGHCWNVSKGFTARKLNTFCIVVPEEGIYVSRTKLHLMSDLTSDHPIKKSVTAFYCQDKDSCC